MNFGYFDDISREYVITTPKTPSPWINYLGNNDFFSLISNTAGGYSFFKDPRLRRLTRYRYNDVPADNNGRYFYLNDGNDIWSAGWKPVKTDLDKYECRHGMGYTRIAAEKNNISTLLTVFVPLNHTCEVQHLNIKNNSAEAKKITLHSYTEWALWDALDDMTNFQRNLSTGEVEVEGSVIYHKTEYRERRNHYAFYSVNEAIQGFDTDRDSFLGLYNGVEMPEKVKDATSGNSIAHGWHPIASHMLEIDLIPGESRDLIFVLGYAENKQEEKFASHQIINKTPAKRCIEAFLTKTQVDEALIHLKQHWDKLLSVYTVKSNEEKMDRMVNIWNAYQCMTTFHFSRSASYFESGIGRGMGFRDSNQDIIGIVHMIPEKARTRILDLAATQLEDGGAYHQYQPLTKKGNNDIGGNFNDDPLWLILAVSAYLKETNDWPILNEEVPFDNNPDNSATLFEHLKRSFNHVINNLGPHGLPLIGRADWNDCLNLNCGSNTPGESFQTTQHITESKAESVFIAAMFVLYGREYAEICNILNKTAEHSRAEAEIEKMKKAVEVHGWDGEWFKRAYDANGNPIGTIDSDEAQIFIEPQGFCVMAGIGHESGKDLRALDSVKKYLDGKYGISLLYPAYSKYHIEIGEITSYPEGYKENGGIFCHNNPWVIIAETVVNNNDRAFEYYKKITPSYIQDISDLHKTEPYVYSQMIAGNEAVKPGEAKNSWLTGTAAWTYTAITNHILGIRADYHGLRVDPKLPSHIKNITVTRKFRGAEYSIEMVNNGTTVAEIILDDKPVAGTLLPSPEAGKKYKVKVFTK